MVITAFKKAYEKRNFPEGLMFHSNRESQYTACAFRQLLDSLNVVQSFSKKGRVQPKNLSLLAGITAICIQIY